MNPANTQASTNERRTAILDAALTYGARGWCIFPIFEIGADGKCACGYHGEKNPNTDRKCSPGKHPRVSWKSLASNDPTVIAAWWQRWPDANIGLACGQRSGVIVIDLDRKPAKHGKAAVDGVASFIALVEANSPIGDTLISRTGSGGAHLFFRHPTGVSSVPDSQGKLGPGIDVRGDGGYVVLPPSNHVSGKHYVWSNSLSLLETSL